MRIDSHQHFWKYDAVRDAWITAEMAVLRRDYLPQDLAPELQRNNVDATIAVQADQSETETLFLLDLAEANSFIAGVVGWVDLRSPQLADRLHFYSRYERLVGFRHIVQAEADDRFLLQDDVMRGLRQLQPYGFTFDLLVYPRQLPAAIEVSSRLPGQHFVLDHVAKPPIRAGERRPWEQHIRELAENPNVYCKVSGLVTEADWQRWTPDDCKPYLDVVFDAFGVDRLMFGSDWPVCLLAGTYSQVTALIADYAQQLAPRALESVMGLNAMRFYRIRTPVWTCN